MNHVLYQQLQQNRAKPCSQTERNNKFVCMSENACALKFDSFYSQQKHTQPCSQVAEKTAHFLAFENIFGNPNCALKFTAKQRPAMQPSVRKFHYAGTVQTSMLCKKMYSKTAPSHAAKWQETTNCLAC